MFETIAQYVYLNVRNLDFIIMGISAILHVIFAGAVAKDAGYWQKQGCRPILVSGITWAFATLVGGVLVVFFYWLIHHSTLRKGV